MKSPIVKCVGMVAWFITGVCALHTGMLALGHDLFMRIGLESNPMANLYVQYACGIAGAVSLVMLVMALMCKSCRCCGESCSKGSCNDSANGAYCSKCGCAPCRCGK